MLRDLFSIHVPVLEIVLRGTLVYWLLFSIFRFVLRRDVGAVGIADILLLVIVADAAQNAMAGGYDTFAEGAVLVCTIVGWNWLLDVLSWRFAWVRRFATPSRLTLVRAGVMQLRNMRREYITRQELEAKLREQGVAELADVEAAYLEGDGQISVIKRETSGSQAGPRKSAAAGGR
jgi:uncharacterized membrane protein YcaP (DUF421 family)